MSINLTYCPEGGEHAWEMWHDDDNDKLIVDCDNCTQTIYEQTVQISHLDMNIIPVSAERVNGILIITPRRDV